VKYRVRISTAAERDMRALPKDTAQRLDARIASLAEVPRPPGAAKLAGRVANAWRVRAGDYRVLYTVDDAERTVSVYRVRARSRDYGGGAA